MEWIFVGAAGLAVLLVLWWFAWYVGRKDKKIESSQSYDTPPSNTYGKMDQELPEGR